MQEVLLTITGIQRYEGEEPETVRLVTEGTMERTPEHIILSYEETELTGLPGTRTVFTVAPDCVTLSRSGALQSRMVFIPGREDRSLYDTGCGALMLAVRTRTLQSSLDGSGGTIYVAYDISIEEQTAGQIEYRVEVRPKNA